MSRRTDVGTVEDPKASAAKTVGLDDFGSDDDNYLEALEVLLDSYRREADFTELGSKMSRFFLRNALVARLLSESSWKQYPQHTDVPITAPIFVTGLPRTGTTALHRLLCGDPATKDSNCGSQNFPNPVPRARPGRRIRFSPNCSAASPKPTPRIPITPGCTS